jgi:hypothetical protein
MHVGAGRQVTMRLVLDVCIVPVAELQQSAERVPLSATVLPKAWGMALTVVQCIVAISFPTTLLKE